MKTKLLTFIVALVCSTALLASNVITYTATEKLSETKTKEWAFASEDTGLHIDAFNVDVSSHAFSNGTGTITFSGEVTSIGYRAFCGCSGLTSITIPNSVTSIGNYAFYGCTGLTSITIPNSVTSIGGETFSGCSGLTSVTIPNSVTSIGDFAFSGCKNLPVIDDIRYADSYLVGAVDMTLSTYKIKEGTRWIGRGAFYGCTSLTSITIPNSVTSIGSSAFYGCTSLTSITIPNSVTSIGSSAFYGCSSLTTVTIGNSVTSIGSEAFSGCSSLTSITIPNSVTSIGYDAFSGCENLPVIDDIRYADSYLVEAVDKTLSTYKIKEGTRWIGEYAFSGCNGLTSITIPNSVTSIASGTFYGCSSLTSITIPNSVTSIGVAAFSGCTGLTSVTIPNSVTEIYRSAFKGCSGLTSVTISNSVTTIRESAFYGCSSLTTVTIGNSVTSIERDAFKNCTGLADIYCYATTPPSCIPYSSNSVVVNVFDDVSEHCYIHVPVGTKRAYELAVGWRHFIHFFEISEISGETSDEVGIEVSGNTAIFTWPVNPTASSYTLVIKKNDEVFCTLTFNSLGQLVGMAFAPARNRNQQSSAESTTYGYSFVVSNLDASSTYDYTFTAKDNKGQILSTQSGSFTTKGETDLLSLPYKGNASRVTKFFRDGLLYILRDGIMYDARGVRIE